MVQSEHGKGLALALGAAFLFSAKAVLVKLAYPYGVSPIALLALRMGMAAPFFAAMAWSHRSTGVALTRRDWLALFSLGVLGYYGASILDFIGLQYITAGLERLILFTYPTITMLISVALLGRPFVRRDLLALGVTWLGIALAFVHDVRLAEQPDAVWVGGLAVLGSAVLYAGYLAGCGEVITKLGTRRVSGIASCMSAGATLAHFAAVSRVEELAQPLPVWMLAAAMAVFSTVVPVFMNLAAMRRLGASRTAIIGSVGPVSTIGLGAVFLGEHISAMQMLGTALVLCGVWLVGKPG